MITMYAQYLQLRTRLVWRAATTKSLTRWHLLLLLVAVCGGWPGRAGAQNTPQIPPSQIPELLPSSLLPKSPTAVPFIRFDEQRNVDLITGAAQAAVPLVELSSGELRLSVGLGYSYSGLKVFQTQDLVGLGWSLQAGGSITRQINGLPDEQASPHPYSSAVVTQVLLNNNQRFLQAALAQDADPAPDIYSFSVDGYSGRFTIQGDNVVLLPAQPLRMERMADGSFQMTTPAGIRYQFATVERTKPNPNNFGRLGEHTSSWLLTRVVSAGNADTISLHYSSAAYTEPRHCVLTTGQYFPDWEAGIYNKLCACSAPYTWRNITPLPSRIQVQYLDSISTRGARVVLTRQPGTHVLNQVRLLAVAAGERRCARSFVLSHSFFPGSPDPTGGARLRLDQVQEQGTSSQVPPYRFSYIPGDMPVRNSLAVDYWGYYNNGSRYDSDDILVTANLIPALLWDPLINTLGVDPLDPPQYAAADRVPRFAYASRGALRQIRYPTGGTTTFDYEGNRYAIQTSADAHKDSLSVVCGTTTSSTNYVPLTTCADTFRLTQKTQVDLILSRANSTQAPSGNNGQTNHTRDFDLLLHRPDGTDSLVTNLRDNQYQIFDNGVDRAYTFQLPRGKYIVRIYCEPYETKTALHLTFTTYTLRRDAPGPGIRVKQTTTTTAGSPALVRTYDYTLTDALGQYSSGLSLLPIDSLGMPRFEVNLFKTSHKDVAHSLSVNCAFFNTSSEYANLGNENSKYLFYYSRVTERNDGNSDINGAVVSDFQAMPLLFNDVLLRNRRTFRLIAGQALRCAQQQTTLYSIGADVEYQALRARVFGVMPPNTIPAEEYVADRYKIITAFVAPSQVIQTQYDEQGDSLTMVTTATYQNERIARTATQTSTGWQISRYKYLSDYSPLNPAVALLRGSGYFDPLIETQSWRKTADVQDSLLVGGQLTIYSDQWHKPMSTWSLRFDQPQPGPNNELIWQGKYRGFFSDTRYQKDASGLYDPESGRLTQQEVPFGPSTAFVWGYNRTYPVVQVENATAAEVLTTLGPATLARLQGPAPGTDAQVRQLLEPLRTRLPRARVTTCTFLPLVGLTSLTDAAGRTAFFEYDDLGRLLRSRDEQDRLLTQQEYHYARP